ncbi:uroporphyrinogen-III synthase [Luteimonas sp. BDR2-5]|uniref:uroporphyrinogen-III synthase n=1 Tax=Proluteimonas luteida TaxID=2878685 RepID=UPI001E3C1FE4|nr:uroporphyrinogen-III synthase [Luteimonas sp. BDR2-5]MCD9027788.1 uroporphyrinogen-III synthase [Luteimonas sp. BDR2-5]
MHTAPAAPQLAGYYVISLRPRGGHAPLRRAAARLGARLFALSPWRIARHDDPATRAALRAATMADRVVFTSPAAVAAAARLQPLATAGAGTWLAVGSGTAQALRRAGVDTVVAPTRMDSEGLLALPAMQLAPGDSVGLVTAPGGRGHIAAAVAAVGATLRRADVYARVPVAVSDARVAALLRCDGPWLLPLSSGEALQCVDDQLPDAARARLRGARVLAASDRLAALARELGFSDIRRAADARPASLLAAARPR